MHRKFQRIGSLPAIGLSAARRVSALVAGLALLLFLVSSLFGGFKMATPLGELSCRHPGRLLLWSLAGAAAWVAASSALHRLRPLPETKTCSEPVLPIRTRGAAVLALTASLLLWLRFLYRAYEPVFGGRPVPTVPWGFIHLLFLFSALAALGAWRRLRETDGEPGALFAALFTALSPLWFHVSPAMVGGYGVLALFWWLAPALAARGPAALRWKAVILASAFALAFVSVWQWGWAGKRLGEKLLSAAPGLTGWLAAAGMVGWWTTRGAARPWLRLAAMLCACGLVLGGARGEPGFAGALLMTPLLSGLTATGTAWLLRLPPPGREILVRNVIVLGLTGILLGLVRDGLDRGIRSPFAPPLDPAPALESPAIPEGVE